LYKFFIHKPFSDNEQHIQI